MSVCVCTLILVSLATGIMVFYPENTVAVGARHTDSQSRSVLRSELVLPEAEGVFLFVCLLKV